MAHPIQAKTTQPFDPEQQLELEKYKSELKEQLLSSTAKIEQLQQNLISFGDTKREILELGNKSVDRWLTALSIILAVISLGFVVVTWKTWTGRETMRQEWEQERTEIKQASNDAFTKMDKAKSELEAQIHDSLTDAKLLTTELREELRYARQMNEHITKICDEAAVTVRSGEATPEAELAALKQNQAQAEYSQQAKLAAKAMELQQDSEWGGAAQRWLALTDLAPDNANYWFNYAYALMKELESKSEKSSKEFDAICSGFKASVDLDQQRLDSLENWGDTLLRWAEFLLNENNQQKNEILRQQKLTEASEKFEQALRLLPKNPALTFKRGHALLLLASTLKNKTQQQKLTEIEPLLKEAYELDHNQTYDLACLKALQNQYEDACYWLKKSKDNHTLPNRQLLESDNDLANLREFPWFQALLDDIV